MKAENKNSKPFAFKGFRYIAAITVAVWLLNLFVAYNWISLEDWLGLKIFSLGDRGSFGDTFAISNTVFSAFALMGIAYGVMLQRHEIGIAEKDRRNLLESTYRQNFDATFFQLFDVFTGIAKSVRFHKRNEDEDFPTGPDAFEMISKLLAQKFQEKRKEEAYPRVKAEESSFDIISDDSASYLSDTERHSLLHMAYFEVFDQYGDDLGRYFRTLYTIMKHVKLSNLLDHEKLFYMKLIRAQLSTHEATMLGLNALSPFTSPEFNSLIVEYGMLKNSDPGEKTFHTFYNRIDPLAFGRSLLKMRQLYYNEEDVKKPFIVKYDSTLFRNNLRSSV